MPLIFIHGVNVRKSPAYDREVAARTELLRRLLLKPLEKAQGGRLEAMTIINVYWGMHGVSFAWGNACLPSVNTLHHMGALDGATPLGDAELQRVVTELGQSPRPGGITPMGATPFGIRAAARKEPGKVAEAILSPLIFSETKCDGQDVLTPEENGRREALLLIAAVESAEDANTRAAIERTANDQDVIEILKRATLKRFEEMSPPMLPAPGLTRMGSEFSQGFKDRVSEIFNRAKQAPARTTTVAMLDLYRTDLHQNFGLFLGDIFVYLQRRGTASLPGPIVTTVCEAIAFASKANPTEPMILVTHSMGGNIVYDILTYYAPELKVDLWISVASQVGLFEEMKIFQASDIELKGPTKVDSLNGLKFWLNVYDPADIFAFKTTPIFSAAKSDLPYLTGDSALKAHGAYFKRPSFYRLILDELKGLDV
jgi:hypothetical protein